MAKQVQVRRGSTAEHASFTGAIGELTVDIDKDVVVVHDGTTAGGHPMMKQDLSNLPAGTIDDADISASAEIAVSKLADGAARQLLQTDAAGTGVEWTSNIDVPGTLDVTGAATFDSAVTISGNLTVNGTTTNINTTNLVVEDKNIIIGDTASPSDTTADGGGLTLKGTTDKTLNWVDSTDAWTSSEHINLATGKSYKINGTDILTSTALGATVQISSNNIPNGTITNDDLAGSIADSKLNTISTTNKVSASALDIDGATDIGGALADADLFIVDDGGAGTNRKAAATRITDYAFGKVSGDITIGSTGTAAIGSGVIVNADVSASAAIAHSKLANITAGQVLLGNSSNVPTATALSGDVTVNSSGVTAIGSGVIVDADVSVSAAIAGSKISPDFGSQNITTSGNVLLTGTGYLDLPVGSTAQRPATPDSGMIRYNSTLGYFEGYGTAWGKIGGGATGGGSDDVFYENGQTVTTSYTMTTGKNAVSAGPIAINSGATVTIPSGQSWVIV